MAEQVVAGMYWCHMCAAAVSPEAAETGVELKCPHCRSGFLEEMETARSAADERRGDGDGSMDPGADSAISIWAPVIDSMVGDPVRRRRSRRSADAAADDDHDMDHFDFSRRRRRATAFLRLLQAIQERQQLRRFGSSAALGGERYSPFGQSIFASGPGGEHGLALGDYYLGPGLDALMQQLAESDAVRQGTPPAKKEAVEALPTVEVSDVNDNDAASCAVCLEDYAASESAREMPCRHRFHSSCILPWLEMHSSCPICRFQLPADDDSKSSCGSGSGSNSGSIYVSADVNDNDDGDDNYNGDERAGTASNAAPEEDEGNGSRLPASIQWLNSLFSLPGSSPSSASASGSRSSQLWED